MLKNTAIFSALVAISALSGCAQTTPPAAPRVSAATPASTPAATLAAAPAAPAWQQGRAADMAASTLAPNPGKLTVTAASDIPIQNLKLPAGFKAEIWSHGTPGVRAMARGESGKIYVGTRALGRVYEITDNGKERTSRVVVDKLNQQIGRAHV